MQQYVVVRFWEFGSDIVGVTVSLVKASELANEARWDPVGDKRPSARGFSENGEPRRIEIMSFEDDRFLGRLEVRNIVDELRRARESNDVKLAEYLASCLSRGVRSNQELST